MQGVRKMIFPTNLEEVAALIEDGKPTVFLFICLGAKAGRWQRGYGGY